MTRLIDFVTPIVISVEDSIQHIDEKTHPIVVTSTNTMTRLSTVDYIIPTKNASVIKINSTMSMDKKQIKETYVDYFGAWTADMTYLVEEEENMYSRHRREITTGNDDDDDDSVTFVIQPSILPAPPITMLLSPVVKINKGEKKSMTIYIHGIDDPSKYKMTMNGNKVLFIKSTTSSIFWNFVCTDVVMEADKTYSFDLSLVGKRNSRRSATSIQTYSMVPMSIKCTITLLPSSIFSSDGQALIFINGGEPSYIFVWNDLPATINTSDTAVYRSGMGIGVYKLTVIDSEIGMGNQLSCILNVYANTANVFHIDSINSDVPTGCAPSVEMVVHATVSHGIPVSIGAWNLDNGESAISTCCDGRLQTITDTLNIFTIVSEPGHWRIAICSDTYLLVTSNGQDQYLPPLVNDTLPLSVSSITVGETCSMDGNVTFITKIPVSFVISDAVGAITITRDGSTPVNGIIYDGLFITVPLLSTGLHTLMIEDERQCPQMFNVQVNFTGFEICGTCNSSDTFCQDQCKVPYGNNDCLYDCVIESISTIKDGNLSSIVFETEYCLNRNMTVIGATSDLVYRNMNITSAVFTPVKTISSLNFGPNTFISYCSNYIYLIDSTFTSTVINRLCLNTLVNIIGSSGSVTVYGTDVVVSNQSSIDFLGIYGHFHELFVDETSHITRLNIQKMLFSQNITNVTTICHLFQDYSNQIDYISIDNGPYIGSLQSDNFCVTTGGVVITKKKPPKDIIHENVIIPTVIVVWLTIFIFLTMTFV